MSRATRAPATRDQVDAYRFGLRRWEAALVRGDPVPLHEQIRSQRRAAFAGVLLGLLGLCGAAAFALVAPRPAWNRQALVVGSESGAMYVVAHGPDRLVPVANLVAGRLVLAALRAGGAADADPAGATPVAVPDADLDAAPRTPSAAPAGAPGVRPDGPAVAPRWAVCDTVGADGALLATTAVGGAVLPPGDPPSSDGLLLADPAGSTWLVVAGVRHRVDVGNGALRAALGLTGKLPRAAATALVSLLPEGVPLATPRVSGRGGAAPAGLGRVGDVLVARPVGAPPRHFVVLAGGLQEVPPVLAELLRVDAGAAEPREIRTEALADAPLVRQLPVAGWPDAAPRLREPADAPVTCWTWAADGPPAGGVWVGAALPVPAGGTPVTLAQADGAGEQLDAVLVGPGGAVRATGPGRARGAGPLWLLSPSGVAHGVADDATAMALGVTGAQPAPEAALRLLPTGPTLDLAQATAMIDVPAAGG